MAAKDVRFSRDARERILKGVRGIAFHHFESCDVVRHPLVQKIVDAYDSWQKQHEPKADA